MACKLPPRLWKEDFCPFDASGMPVELMHPTAPAQDDFERSAHRALFVARSSRLSATTSDAETISQIPYNFEKVVKAIRYLTQSFDREPDVVLINQVDVEAWATAFRGLVSKQNDWCYLRYWEPEKLRPPCIGGATMQVYDLYELSHSHQDCELSRSGSSEHSHKELSESAMSIPCSPSTSEATAPSSCRSHGCAESVTAPWDEGYISCQRTATTTPGSDLSSSDVSILDGNAPKQICRSANVSAELIELSRDSSLSGSRLRQLLARDYMDILHQTSPPQEDFGMGWADVLSVPDSPSIVTPSPPPSPARTISHRRHYCTSPHEGSDLVVSDLPHAQEITRQDKTGRIQTQKHGDLPRKLFVGWHKEQVRLAFPYVTRAQDYRRAVYRIVTSSGSVQWRLSLDNMAGEPVPDDYKLKRGLSSISKEDILFRDGWEVTKHDGVSLQTWIPTHDVVKGTDYPRTEAMPTSEHWQKERARCWSAHSDEYLCGANKKICCKKKQHRYDEAADIIYVAG